MEKKELLTLLEGGLTRRVDPKVNFEDSTSAIKNALMAHYGLTKDSTYREIKNACSNFAILEEAIDEVLPKALENIMGQWANIVSYGPNDEVIYKIKGLGKRRAMLGIAPGARAGIYNSYRLDDKNLSIKTHIYTAGAEVSLYDIITGRLTLGDLMDQILQGLTYQVYKDIVSALRTIKVEAPAVNRKSAAGFVPADMDALIRVVSAYGEPVMICFKAFAAKISNVIGTATAFNPNVPAGDLDSWRAQGFQNIYKGTKAIVLPNFILDEVTNDTWAFSEKDCFVLPVDAKPVIVAMRGDAVITQDSFPAGGEMMNLHKEMGTAILAYNNLGVYTDTTIADEGQI